jgi:hypothetical protein
LATKSITTEQNKILEEWIRKQDISSRKATVLVNGKSHRKTHLYKIISEMPIKELRQEGLLDVAEINPTALNRLFLDIIQLIKTEGLDTGDMLTHEGEELLSSLGVAELANHEEYKNVDGYIVYSKKTLEITDINYKIVKRRFTLEKWNYLYPTFPILRVEYDPYNSWRERVKAVNEGDMKFTHLNLYRSPAWSHVPVKRPQIPPLIKEYLDFLFADEESREFALGWIYNAMVYRAKTYLFLVGGEGAGKTTFALLVERLIGKHNSVKAKEDFLRNNFNDIIENKRLVYLDEFHATSQKETDILKSRIEDTITLEGKHKDQKVVTNYSSFILLNNYFTSVRVDPSTGRKFSVPEITDKSIIMEKGQDFMVNLIKSINSDNHIAHLAAYILDNYKDKVAPHQCLHTHRYEKVTCESASEGMRQLINLLMVEGYDESIVVKDVRSQHRKLGRGERFPSNMEIEKFFERFMWFGKRVGETSYDDDEGLLLSRHEDFKGAKL